MLPEPTARRGRVPRRTEEIRQPGLANAFLGRMRAPSSREHGEEATEARTVRAMRDELRSALRTASRVRLRRGDRDAPCLLLGAEGRGRVKFYLGTHQPHWLGDARFTGVPLFISRRTLGRYVKLPRAVTDFALDSGGFSELQLHGRWSVSAYHYAEEALDYKRLYGRKLRWVAPQDWMCEPIVLHGGVAGRGVVFKGTGLTVEKHQRRTVSNFVLLRRLMGDLVIPVLQGWTMADYWRCCDLYEEMGVRLKDERTVGVGTVCRRQSSSEATTIMTTLAADGLRLHGFGFKKGGLKNCADLLVSSDSMAWSDAGRRNVGLPGHDKPGHGRPRGHKNCANCAEWALMWRKDMLASIEAHRGA